MAVSFSIENRNDKNSADMVMLACLILLAGIGVATLYSASYGYAVTLQKSPGYFALRQIIYFLPASIALFLACAYIPLSFLRKYSALAIFASLLLLALPFLPGIGITKNGASRWFGFGSFQFQPSELFKPALIFYLAHIFSKKEGKLPDLVNSILPPLLITVAGVGLILLQNDFSTAMLIGSLAMVMFWIAEVPLVFFGAAVSLTVPLASLSVLTSDYRLRRVLGFLAPSFDPADISYQVNSSLRAIRSGGLLGKGIGQGTLKLRSIPEVQSDFVFAAWVEETGFAGVLFFVALWSLFLYRAYRLSLRSADSFSSFLVFGMASYLGLQTIINISVACGLVPATGVPLPFFSAGGSSILSVAITCGFIFQCSLKNGAQVGGREEGGEYV